MSLTTKIGLFVGITLALGVVDWYWLNVASPTMASHLAVNQLQNSDIAAEKLRVYETGGKNVVFCLTTIIEFLTILFLFAPCFKSACSCAKDQVKNTMLFLFGISIILGCSGCYIPYDAPEFQEIQNNETGFLLPLEG